MTAAPCSAEHPLYPETHCNRPIIKPHPQHSAYSWDQGRYISWPNEAYAATESQKKALLKGKEDRESKERRTLLHRIADRVKHGNKEL